MNIDPIYKYYKKLLKKAEKELQKVVLNPDEKNLHKLRISIKQLRAFYRFVFAIDKSFPYKYCMAPWKSLYAYFGAIRNSQVVLKRAKHFCGELKIPFNPENYSDEISDREPDKIRNKFKKESIAAVKKSLQKLTTISAERYMNQQFNKIIKLLHHQDMEKKGRLHELRKALKDFSFNLIFLTAINPAFKDKKTLEWMKNIMAAIGKWLDLNMILKYINQNQKQSDRNSPENNGNLIKNEILTKRENIVTTILQMCENGKILLDKEDVQKGINQTIPKKIHPRIFALP